ncbi:MAG TPA: cytochrome P450 [Myxococcota bacterium]|nr:cytochrome P450 [Myxococcota bacterium]
MNASVSRADLPALDFDDAYFRAPQATIAKFTSKGARAARIPQMGTVMLLRYADVHAALLDRRLGAMGVRYYEQQGWTSGPYIEWVRSTLVFLDPPDHDRLRALLGRAFTPRQVARVRPIAEQIAAHLADAAAEKRDVDLYDAFAQRLPLQVICEMLGIPSVDHEQVHGWTAALSLATAYPTPAARVAADAAMTEMNDYTLRMIAERRARPGEDLLSALIAAEESGDRLSPKELVAMVVQLLYAGHETTRNLIGNGLFCLLTHPDELSRLRAEPARIMSAVEEMLRYEPPIIFLSRVALEDVTAGGVAFAKGELLHLSLASANRDVEAFANPDRFDVARDENRHVTFGFGAHFCIGAAIARMEARVAFETLLGRFPRIELRGETPRWASSTALRTLETFPVRLETQA